MLAFYSCMPQRRIQMSNTGTMSSQSWFEDAKRQRMPRALVVVRTMANRTRRKKSVRFATNSKNGSPWVLIKRIDKIEDMKLVDELWWTEEEMCLRNESDNNMANVVETHYEGILQDAFQSTGSGKVRPGAKKIKDVALDMERMKKIGAARGLESLVSPEIQKNVKKHRRAVMGAQQILRDHKRDLSDDKSVEMIAQASLKYSQPSRLVSKKMAQFDNEAGQYGFKSAGPRKPTTSQ
mmetsp:Transcript_11465/g.25563  ORF Transcript_11465/g.25563 Transcript_11465/m.25563 type:complete len:237 (+) Transcript_11465:252-962(+)